MSFWLLVLPLAAVAGAGLAPGPVEDGKVVPVLIGRTLAVLALLTAALAVALVASPVPVGLIAYAGFVPLLRGVRRLGSGRFRPDPDVDPPPVARTWLAGARQTVTSGGDLLAIGVPLFATHTVEEVAALGAAIAAGALVAIVARRAIAGGLQPLCLVAVGAYVLIEGGAFNWLVAPLLRR
jgi:cadmium resistance protein CadD (predicted permease)